MKLPAQLSMPPVTGPVSGIVRPPGSKSYSNRALPLAAWAVGASRLTGVLDSEDTGVMITALRQLGIYLADEGPGTWQVTGCGGQIPALAADLNLANSGTSIRFLTAMLATAKGVFSIDGNARMRQRPINDLLDALRRLDVVVEARHSTQSFPLTLSANGLGGGMVAVRGDSSSQFLSGLLMAAPLARAPVTVLVEGTLVSEPYVAMTLATMQAFGQSCRAAQAVLPNGQSQRAFVFPGRGCYRGTTYTVEPDASAASYFFAAAAITGGTVTVDHLGTESLQGDLGFVKVLQTMGCTITQTATGTTVQGEPLHGVTVDMCHLSDTVPTLSAVACFAQGPTTIYNVAHMRHKETDRIAAVVTELRKTGLRVEEEADRLTIHPGPMHGACFHTYDDHRMAMSLALLGLRVPGVVINDPGCVAKTYPAYFTDLQTLLGR